LTVSEGNTVEIIAPDSDGWTKVKLNQNEGWVPTGYLEMIVEVKTEDRKAVDIVPETTKHNPSPVQEKKDVTPTPQVEIKAKEPEKVEPKAKEPEKIQTKAKEPEKIETKAKEPEKIQTKAKEPEKIESKAKEPEKVESKSKELEKTEKKKRNKLWRNACTSF